MNKWQAKIKELLESRFPPHSVPKGTMLFQEGSFCSAVPFLKEGELKVYLISESGREITLYTVMPGSMCILAMLTAYSGSVYPAYTRAEVDSWLHLVPSEVAVRWFEEQACWRSLFMKDLTENLLSLMTLLNSMVSERVEKRLAGYLLAHSKNTAWVEKTHEEIAKDVGSVRVVVSRILKELEREGILQLSRGRLFIKDIGALKRRAGDAHP